MVVKKWLCYRVFYLCIFSGCRLGVRSGQCRSRRFTTKLSVRSSRGQSTWLTNTTPFDLHSMSCCHIGN